MGMTASARPIPAVMALSRMRMLNASWSQLASTIRAKKPITTEGIPARSSTAGLITSRTPCGANSEVKIAAPTEIGSAIRRATIVTFRVPISRGSSEYLGTVETGCQECSPFACGASILQTVTSLWTSDEVRSGTASFPTKMKIRMTDAMTMKPLDRTPNSISASRRRGFPDSRSGSGSAKGAPFLRLARVDRLELGQGDFLELVGLMNEDREAVQRHGELDGLLPLLLLDQILLLGLHRTRSLADVGAAADERRDARAGAAAGDLDRNVGVGLHVVLRPALAQDHHGVGALDRDGGLPRRRRAGIARPLLLREGIVADL